MRTVRVGPKGIESVADTLQLANPAYGWANMPLHGRLCWV
jgi:hypothetical protein